MDSSLFLHLEMPMGYGCVVYSPIVSLNIHSSYLSVLNLAVADIIGNNGAECCTTDKRTDIKRNYNQIGAAVIHTGITITYIKIKGISYRCSNCSGIFIYSANWNRGLTCTLFKDLKSIVACYTYNNIRSK